ncbi:MAG: Uma2 family endonuclease [Lachnospiraceae bacterium]|nr:Uma2 family endonuclease [Lachnospiraceae bacterium]
MALPDNKNKTIEDILMLKNGQRAELIDGEMYYIPPSSIRQQEIITWLAEKINNYIKENKKLCKVFKSPFPVYISNDKKNYVEPGLSIICNDSILKDGKCSGAPDWITEVVAPNGRWTAYCLKLAKYYESGVREYWITDLAEHSVMVYNFEQRNYNRYTFNDKIKSSILEGLEINLSQMQI